MAEAKLESLANELLLDIFPHLIAVNLLDAFHHLNSRFDTLLFIYSRRQKSGPTLYFEWSI